MAARAISLLCTTVLLAVPALSQAAQGDAEAAQYVGALTGTNVYVRSGPGAKWYPCTKLSAPAQVNVVGVSDGWLKILAPPGCFSVISKTYVTADETGKAATVTGDNVWVRAGGDQHTSDFWVIQRRLNSGQKVEIIGEAGDFYKIVPPEGVHFYISKIYVAPVEQTAVTEEQSALPASTTLQATQPAVSRKTKQELDLGLAMFQAAEKALQAEYGKPLAERDIPSILEKYQAIKLDEDNSYLKPYVEARTRFLQAAIEQKAELQIVENLVKQTATQQKQYELERTKIEVALPPRRMVTAYDAEGVLSASDIFIGGPYAAKRFLVRDRKTHRITAYVQSTTREVDLRKYTGKHVGVLGVGKYDKDLAIDVIDVEQVIVLQDKVQLPGPPRPVVAPAPIPPAPKPAAKPAPEPKAKVTPAPVARPRPATKPSAATAPKAKARPARTAKPKIKAKPAPKPAAKPKARPKALPQAKPSPKPKPEAKPADQPTTKPAAPPADSPTTKSAMPRITAKPLPPTGLPMVSPNDGPAPAPINEKEYD